jgi:hypothetical protein
MTMGVIHEAPKPAIPSAFEFSYLFLRVHLVPSQRRQQAKDSGNDPREGRGNASGEPYRAGDGLADGKTQHGRTCACAFTRCFPVLGDEIRPPEWPEEQAQVSDDRKRNEKSHSGRSAFGDPDLAYHFTQML